MPPFRESPRRRRHPSFLKEKYIYIYIYCGPLFQASLLSQRGIGPPSVFNYTCYFGFENFLKRFFSFFKGIKSVKIRIVFFSGVTSIFFSNYLVLSSLFYREVPLPTGEEPSADGILPETQKCYKYCAIVSGFLSGQGGFDHASPLQFLVRDDILACLVTTDMAITVLLWCTCLSLASFAPLRGNSYRVILISASTQSFLFSTISYEQ